MGIQVLAISGSRNRKGQTARAINAVLKGVAEAGGTSESIFLPELAIERCRQCDINGYGICRTEGRCIIKDDFAAISDKIKNADIMVFASPVYYMDLCESLRAFLERYHRTRPVHRPVPGQGTPGIVAMGRGQPAIGLCYAGVSGYGTISCAASLEKLLNFCGFDVVDMVPVRRQNIDFKLPLLEAEGRWLVTKPTSGSMPPPLLPGQSK